MISEAQRKIQKEKAKEEFLSTKKIEENIRYCREQVKIDRAHYPNWDDETMLIALEEIQQLRRKNAEQNGDIQRLRGALYQRGHR